MAKAPKKHITALDELARKIAVELAVIEPGSRRPPERRFSHPPIC